MGAFIAFNDCDMVAMITPEMAPLPLETGIARARLWRLLGGCRRRRPRILARHAAEAPATDVIAEHLLLDLNGLEPVPALFLRPVSQTRPPLVLYGHAHGNRYDIGKQELLQGRPALADPPYGIALPAAGYAVLAIDNWLFGERPRHGGENAFAKARLLHGDTVWGMMLRDQQAALDLAVAELEVDASRIAALGLSMGASLAWWLAALDERIKVCIDLCCMTDFHAAIETGGIDGHGIYYCVPRLLKHFSTADIVALIAPRPHLSLNGRLDPLTPETGLRRIDLAMRQCYRQFGASAAWRMEVHDIGHQETPAMRQEVLDFLGRWL